MSVARVALLFVVGCAQATPAAPPPSNVAKESGPVVATASTEMAAFELARAQHKGVMIELYASWSMPCVELERSLRDPIVATVLAATFVWLRFDVSKGTAADLALRERYAAQTQPALLFVAASGSMLGGVTQYLDPAQLAKVITAAAPNVNR